MLLDDSEDRVAFKLSGNTLTFTKITDSYTQRSGVLTADRFTKIKWTARRGEDKCRRARPA